MTETALALLFVIPGYVVGSISSGYLVGKMYRNVDLRRVGSGSTGATNTLRALGPGAALLVAVLDIAKGAGAVWIARAFVEGGEALAVAQAAAAAGAVAGHCWPLLLEGRGGRGVATGFGALLFIATPAWAGAVAGFFVALVLTRIVSVGSLAAVAGAVLGYMLFSATGLIAFHWAALTFIVISATIITVRHRPNIERLLRGAEPKLGARA